MTEEPALARIMARLDTDGDKPCVDSRPWVRSREQALHDHLVSFTDATTFGYPRRKRGTSVGRWQDRGE